MGAGPVPTPPMARTLRRASSVLSGALQHIFRQAWVRPPFNVLCKSPWGALRALFLVPQCYFLIVGVGPASTPPADRALFRVLSARGRFIRCTAACSLPSRREAWGPAPCLVPHSPALLPRCGCRACAGIAGGPLTPSCPQCTRALYPLYCHVFSVRPRRGRSSMSSTSPPGLYSVPRSLFTSIASSLWVLGPHRHRRWTAHSATPPVHTGALSDALQCVFCPSEGRPPFNDLCNSPGGALCTSILVPQRYFLVVGAEPAPSPPVECALHRALSACGRFV
ncbi:hypothetical protein NDU88_003248 [Pleurodeles waltl]|uniref:Uncharacterized protein n=1 Tax=Pleurodeles waltl TaxID=8319 RepID=A0AAV7QC90_PLEWA|nr:hypothetical protein NDU88_003248 [Pleurodeles waltl]